MSTPEDAPAAELMNLASDAAPAFESARRTLLAQGERAIPMLLAGLEDARLGSIAHGRILRILGELGRDETLPAIRGVLRRSLRDGDPIVRSAAMEALAGFQSEQAVHELIALFDHPVARVAGYAAVLAGQTRMRAALAPLQGLLASPDASLRYAAAVGLIRLNDAQARQLLSAHMLREHDAEVRELIRAAGIAAAAGPAQ